MVCIYFLSHKNLILDGMAFQGPDLKIPGLFEESSVVRNAKGCEYMDHTRMRNFI